ncbi:MAG: hypothetical protein V3S55_09695 [Nitrospiraceae bacterium]
MKIVRDHRTFNQWMIIDGDKLLAVIVVPDADWGWEPVGSGLYITRLAAPDPEIINRLRALPQFATSEAPA